MRRRKSILLLVLVSMLLLTSCKKTSEKAQIALKEGNFNEAEELYLQLLEEEPDVESYYGLIQVYRAKMDLEKEKAILDEALAKYPDSKKLRLSEVSYNEIVGRNEDAINILKSLLEEETSEEILGHLINIYKDMGRYSEIKDLYKDYNDSIKTLKNLDIIYEVYQIVGEELDIITELEEKLKLAQEEENNGSILQGYKYVESNPNLDLRDMVKGRFIDRNRDDIALVFNTENYELIIEIINGQTGELLLSYKLDGHQSEAAKLDYIERKNKLDAIALRYSTGMSASMPATFLIYEVNEDLNKLEEIEIEIYEDIDIVLEEDFKIGVSSEKLNKEQIVPIDNDDKLGFIADGQYKPNGKPREKDLVRIYEDDHNIIRNNGRKDTVEITIGFGGSYEYSADRTAYLKGLYQYKSGKYELVFFYIEDKMGEGLVEGNLVEEGDSGIEDIFPDYLVEYDFQLYFDGIGEEIFAYSDVEYIKKVLGEGESEVLEEVNDSAKYVSYNVPGLEIIYLDVIKENGRSERYNQMVLITEEGISTLRGLEVGMDYEELKKVYSLDKPIKDDQEETIYMIEENNSDIYIHHIDLFIALDKETGKVTRYNYATAI